jgi:rRNA maturation endonuclease Nob1
MKFKSFVLEDEDTYSSEELMDTEVCELGCDTCEFETTDDEFVEGDICPECGEGVLISNDCDDDDID